MIRNGGQITVNGLSGSECVLGDTRILILAFQFKAGSTKGIVQNDNNRNTIKTLTNEGDIIQIIAFFNLGLVFNQRVACVFS